MKIRREFIVLLQISLIALLAGSCLKDNTEELQAAHDAAFRALKQEYGITEDENIGDNIYVHFTYMPDTLVDEVLCPGGEDYVVIDYVGLNSDQEAFDVTREEDAEQYGLHRDDVVYGPIRLDVNQTFLGFYKAIQHVPERSSAVILIPHDQAFLNYEPIVYEVTVYRVIEDLEAYDNWQFQVYMDSLGISVDDSIPGAPDAFYKILTEGDSVPDFDAGDSVTISIYGYYAETDTAYVESFPGRQFFPINESGDIVTFALGDVIFPISPIVNYAVYDMKPGESREILSPSKYTYGEDGFIHPYIGVYIIPPSIPLHYTIRLDDYEKMN